MWRYVQDTGEPSSYTAPMCAGLQLRVSAPAIRYISLIEHRLSDVSTLISDRG